MGLTGSREADDIQGNARSADTALQRSAAKRLQDLYHAAGEAPFRDSGLWSAFARLLHSDDGYVLKNALVVAYHLLQRDEFRRRFTAEGLHMLVVANLCHAQRGVVTYCQSCLMYLPQLPPPSDPDLKTLARHGLRPLRLLLDSAKPALQVFACLCLVALARLDTPLSDVLSELVYTLVRLHDSDDVGVVTAVAEALCAVSVYEQAQAEIVKHHGIEALVVMSVRDIPSVMANAAHALRNICQNDDLKKAVIDESGVQALIHTLSASMSSGGAVPELAPSFIVPLVADAFVDLSGCESSRYNFVRQAWPTIDSLVSATPMSERLAGARILSNVLESDRVVRYCVANELPFMRLILTLLLTDGDLGVVTCGVDALSSVLRVALPPQVPARFYVASPPHRGHGGWVSAERGHGLSGASGPPYSQPTVFVPGSPPLSSSPLSGHLHNPHQHRVPAHSAGRPTAQSPRGVVETAQGRPAPGGGTMSQQSQQQQQQQQQQPQQHVQQHHHHHHHHHQHAQGGVAAMSSAPVTAADRMPPVHSGGAVSGGGASVLSVAAPHSAGSGVSAGSSPDVENAVVLAVVRSALRAEHIACVCNVCVEFGSHALTTKLLDLLALLPPMEQSRLVADNEVVLAFLRGCVEAEDEHLVSTAVSVLRHSNASSTLSQSLQGAATPSHSARGGSGGARDTNVSASSTSSAPMADVLQPQSSQHHLDTSQQLQADDDQSQQQQQQQQQRRADQSAVSAVAMSVITVKCNYQDEMRVLTVPVAASLAAFKHMFAESIGLLGAAASAFVPLMRIQYQDAEGDIVTVRSEVEWRGVMTWHVKRSAAYLARTGNTEPPALRLHVMRDSQVVGSAPQPLPVPAGAGGARGKSMSVASMGTDGTPNFSYQVGSLIGTGAYGQVFIGLRDTGDLVAVKRVQLPNTTDERGRLEIAALEHEIELMKDMQHENIVAYLGYKRIGNTLEIVLEYVPGGSIGQLLHKFGRFNEHVIRRYTRQLLLGLQYLHSRNIMHRDIKGDNVLVTDTGVVKLADFNCARRIQNIFDSADQRRSLMGTPYFMAPEVIQQRGHDFKADIWSVGCTIIEMATGKPPFAHISDPLSAMFQIVIGNEMPIPETLSPAGRDFVRLCLQRDPNRRPTASELLMHSFVADEDELDDVSSVPPTPLAAETAPMGASAGGGAGGGGGGGGMSAAGTTEPETINQFLRDHATTILTNAETLRASPMTGPRALPGADAGGRAFDGDAAALSLGEAVRSSGTSEVAPLRVVSSSQGSDVAPHGAQHDGVESAVRTSGGSGGEGGPMATFAAARLGASPQLSSSPLTGDATAHAGSTPPTVTSPSAAMLRRPTSGASAGTGRPGAASVAAGGVAAAAVAVPASGSGAGAGASAVSHFQATTLRNAQASQVSLASSISSMSDSHDEEHALHEQAWTAMRGSAGARGHVHALKALELGSVRQRSDRVRERAAASDNGDDDSGDNVGGAHVRGNADAVATDDDVDESAEAGALSARFAPGLHHSRAVSARIAVPSTAPRMPPLPPPIRSTASTSLPLASRQRRHLRHMSDVDASLLQAADRRASLDAGSRRSDATSMDGATARSSLAATEEEVAQARAAAAREALHMLAVNQAGAPPDGAAASSGHTRHRSESDAGVLADLASASAQSAMHQQ